MGQHSHHLNLIESLWIDMETELGETWGRVGNADVLQDLLRLVWENIPKEQLSSLIWSMPAHLQAVIDSGNCVLDRV